MSEHLRWTDAPKMPGLIHREANRVANAGGIAIVGLAVPWDDTNSRGELMRRLAIGSGMAPPLFDGHPDNATTDDGKLGTGELVVAGDDGLYAVWKLDPTLAVFDHIVEAAVAGQTGLSIAFFPSERTQTQRGGEPVLEHVSAKLGDHVALTGKPSYRNARVLAIVGAFATMVYRSGRGMVSIGPTSRLHDQREHVALQEYAHTGDKELLGTVPPSIQNYEAERQLAESRSTVPVDGAATAVIDRRGLTVEHVVSGFELLEVRNSHGSNFLECRAVPYGVVTTRTPTPERFRRGAFAGIHPKTVKLRDQNHDRNRRPAGEAVRLEERADGLYGEFRFYRTPEGRAAYENVSEGTYAGVSVGFIALEEATIAGIREIRRARLDHVSLVDSPAYTGADIIAVRNTSRP